MEPENPAKVHIEHIMPLHMSEPWQAALGAHAVELHAESVDRWGNLTLLAERLNKEATDSSFDAKKKKFAESKTTMTQLLLQEAKWGPTEVEARQRWLALIADQLWSPTEPSLPETSRYLSTHISIQRTPRIRFGS